MGQSAFKLNGLMFELLAKTGKYKRIIKGLTYRLTAKLGPKHVLCPCCDWEGPAFMTFGGRRNAQCPVCKSLERHRLCRLYLRFTLKNDAEVDFLHFAPDSSMRNHSRHYPKIRYVSADIGSKSAMRKEDMMQTSFDDNSFDYVLCSNVLEHVENDQKAMREMHRILKSDGAFIVMVPLTDRETTDEDASVVSPNERAERFGQYNHVRYYGRDIIDRLSGAGFSVNAIHFTQRLSQSEVLRYGLHDEIIFECIK